MKTLAEDRLSRRSFSASVYSTMFLVVADDRFAREI
jgi:hypothetical protein